ncbi:MAG: hypothetical protein M3N50_00865 [Pseudomonadota bacterium]|nr:hypothetical protein [Pseudomonadota bacterium]
MNQVEVSESAAAYRVLKRDYIAALREMRRCVHGGAWCSGFKPLATFRSATRAIVAAYSPA